MKIQDLLHAWEQAADDATVEQKRTDETNETLDVSTGLRAGAWICDKNGERCHWV